MNLENKTDHLGIWCDVEAAFVAYALTHHLANKAKDRHVQKTGHSRRGIRIRNPKKK